MRILITGALGHIGSYLLYSIPKKIKCELIILDSFKTQRYSSLFNLPKNHKISFFEEDVRNINRLKNKLKHVDVVIHLAALTNAADSVGREKEFIENNFKGTSEVIKYCIKNNSKLIYISSTSIYGTQKNLVDENCSSADLKPQSPYAISKFKEEKLILSNSKASNLKMIILRFGTIFGVSKGIRFHTAVNKFCFQAAKGEKLSVWRTALNQKRPYLDLKDASNSIVHIIKNNIFDNEVYNVLTNNFTVKKIISLIKKFLPRTKFEYVNSPIMNQLSYEISNQKFKNKKFKFKGDINLEIKKTLNLFKYIVVKK
jgi:UDP-glucose 4-epimerase|tara:strand:+ start:56 stop:997 length:942 start_codon:yes stop_codon:yes gene_type:complete